MARRTVAEQHKRFGASVCDLVALLSRRAAENKEIWKDRDTRSLALQFGSVVAPSPTAPVDPHLQQERMEGAFAAAIAAASEKGHYGHVLS